MPSMLRRPLSFSPSGMFAAVRVAARTSSCIVALSLACGCQMGASGKGSRFALFKQSPQKKQQKSFEEFLAESKERQQDKLSKPAASTQGKIADKSGKPRYPRSAGPNQLDTKQLLQQGIQAETRQQFDEAKENYLAVLDVDPGNGDAHHRLGVLADLRNDFTQAEDHYLKAIKAKPRDADLHSDLGYSYALRGLTGQSESHLKKALQLDAQHANAAKNLGQLYAKQGRMNEADRVMKSAFGETESRRLLAELSNTGGGESAPEWATNEPGGIRQTAGQAPEWGGGAARNPKDMSFAEVQQAMEQQRMRAQQERARRSQDGAEPAAAAAADRRSAAPDWEREPHQGVRTLGPNSSPWGTGNETIARADAQRSPENSMPQDHWMNGFVPGGRAAVASAPQAQFNSASQTTASASRPVAPVSSSSTESAAPRRSNSKLPNITPGMRWEHETTDAERPASESTPGAAESFAHPLADAPARGQEMEFWQGGSSQPAATALPPNGFAPAVQGSSGPQSQRGWDAPNPAMDASYANRSQAAGQAWNVPNNAAGGQPSRRNMNGPGRSPSNDPAQVAAWIGMGVGPGNMFPQTRTPTDANDYGSSNSLQMPTMNHPQHGGHSPYTQQNTFPSWGGNQMLDASQTMNPGSWPTSGYEATDPSPSNDAWNRPAPNAANRGAPSMNGSQGWGAERPAYGSGPASDPRLPQGSGWGGDSPSPQGNPFSSAGYQNGQQDWSVRSASQGQPMHGPAPAAVQRNADANNWSDSPANTTTWSNSGRGAPQESRRPVPSNGSRTPPPWPHGPNGR